MSKPMAFRTQLLVALLSISTLALLYLLVFLVADGSDFFGATRAAVCNAVPIICFGWLVAARIAPLLWPPLRWPRACGVLVSLAAYSVTTYIATLLLLSLTGGEQGEGRLIITYFSGPAFVWQSFQGLAYGAIALLVGWLVALERPTDDNGPAREPLGRLLVRTDQGIVPIDGSTIIRIAAADDYCEIILPGARHLARMTMGECETLLANEPIIRVHRSHLINLRHLASAEPAGDGRLTLVMANGDTVTSSRAGARAIRGHSG
jgi:hypothetical protein